MSKREIGMALEDLLCEKQWEIYGPPSYVLLICQESINANK